VLLVSLTFAILQSLPPLVKGYIGGSVLARLLNHPKRDTFDITILIRTAAKAREFESFGLKVVIGTLDDLDVLERLASESDFVFQTVRVSSYQFVRAGPN
jgi:uncharacterized protein YbjT (DUF2867 family)